MQREVTLVLGQTGSGKTYWANEFMQEHPRVLIADAGFEDFDATYVYNYPDLVEYLQDHETFNSGRVFRIGYDFPPGEHDLIFSTALELRDLLLVLEEADRFDFSLPDYQNVVYRGRHFGISLLLVSLSPRNIPTEVRRQATRIVSFRQIFPDDIKWLAEIIGEDAYKLVELTGPPEKPPHPYLLWTAEGGVKIERADKLLTKE